MNNYPFDPKLQLELTKLYHNFIKNATTAIKNSNLEFSKVVIQKQNSYHCNDISLTKCKSACLYYENFLLASVDIGTVIL